jgi:hypothetical protein
MRARVQRIPAKAGAAPTPSWQFNAEHDIETARKVGLRRGGGQQDQVGWRQRSLQSSQHIVVETSRARPLLGKAKCILFDVRISGAGFKLSKIGDLLVTESDPPTEGFVVMKSDMARADLSHLDVD